MARYLWTQREDIGPSPRVGHAMTYDSTRSQAILFGGDALAGAFLNDTWEWNGQYWTQIADIGPKPRRDHAICFDTVRNVVLLFGGASGQAPFGDTWSWNGQDWTQLDDSGPSARAGHALVFDPARGRAVLFGGETATGLVNDTWEWDGNAWTQQEDTGPSPRKYHSMAFDVVRNQVVLFGGDPGNGIALGDTWSWDGTNWTQKSSFGASPCLRAAMVSTDVEIAIFGGLSSSKAAPTPTVFHESWVFDGKHWTHRQDIGPGPRWAHAMTFDTARRSIVLFGGLPIFGAQGDAKLPARLLGDTWEHLETDAPPPSGVGAQPGGQDGFNLQLAVNPPSAAPGTQVQIIVTLTAPAEVETLVDLGWMLQSELPPNVNNINLIGQIIVAAGTNGETQAFEVPNVSEPIVIIAMTQQGSAAEALLNIT